MQEKAEISNPVSFHHFMAKMRKRVENIEVMFFVIFTIIIGVFVFTFVKGISEWNNNNQSPRLTLEAKIVGKRADTKVYRHNHADGTPHTTHSTRYYVTFQVESGDRMQGTFF